MKKIHYIIPTSVLLLTIVAYQFNKRNQPSPSALVDVPQSSNSPTKARFEGSSDEQSLAAKGMLWETLTTNPRERAAKSMTIAADSFSEAKTKAVGSTLTLRFSEKIPALDAQIISRDTAIDGTIVTGLRIPGTPEGKLTIQENTDMDFFLAQLYYENYPVAYEFKKSSGNLVANRHLVSELMCAFVDKTLEVTQIGMPVVDPPVSQEPSSQNPTKQISEVQNTPAEITAEPELKASEDALLPEPNGTLSISDASIKEGDSGTQDLTFTVTLDRRYLWRNVTVDYTTSDGTATAGSDYQAVSGTVTIRRWTTSATFTVPILGDKIFELNEKFTINLSNPVNASIEDGQATGTIMGDDAFTPIPVFNSHPEAEAVIYLDMDGEVVLGTQWNFAVGPIVANGIAGLVPDSEILEICRRVAEDFSPFQINVTTSYVAYLAAPANRRIRCIFTPNKEWHNTSDTVVATAYGSSFTWEGDTPCWVFRISSSIAKVMAESTSKVLGLTLGLKVDDSTSTDTNGDGYLGHGSGEVSWAPIMGQGWNKNLSQWSKGEYSGANNTEDDLNIITTKNGFGYRADDVGNTISTAKALTGTNGERSAAGIIETRDDVDVFSFSTKGGSCSFTVLGDATSQNLDIKVEILNSSGSVVTSANPDTLTDATVTKTLTSGKYFLRVSGVGREDPLIDGYSDYGSLGQYTVSGTAP